MLIALVLCFDLFIVLLAVGLNLVVWVVSGCLVTCLLVLV